MRWTAFVLLPAAMLLAAACGGGGEETTPTSTPTPAATETPEPQPTATSTRPAPTATMEPTQAPPTDAQPETGGPRFDPASLSCVDAPSPTIDREWQVSAPRGVPGPVRPGEVTELGLRNKFGASDESYWAGARVIAPDGTSFTTATSVTGDAWGYVIYPTGFSGAVPLGPGAYTVVWEINGGYIACDGFVVEDY